MLTTTQKILIGTWIIIFIMFLKAMWEEEWKKNWKQYQKNKKKQKEKK